MNYKEYGINNKKVIMLLHGGGLSWWNYRDGASLLSVDYHVIIPILDGHSGSDKPFTGIASNANDLISLIEEKFGGKILLIGGLSLGGQILIEMLTQRKDICSYALIESASVIASKITNALIGPAISSSYWLIKKRGFAKMQFKSLHLKKELFEDYYHDTSIISKKNMIAFLKASTSYVLNESFSDVDIKMHYCYGGKENKIIQRSSKVICAKNTNCSLHVLNGLYHGEFSINNPKRYVDAIRNIILDRKW